MKFIAHASLRMRANGPAHPVLIYLNPDGRTLTIRRAIDRRGNVSDKGEILGHAFLEHGATLTLTAPDGARKET